MGLSCCKITKGRYYLVKNKGNAKLKYHNKEPARKALCIKIEFERTYQFYGNKYIQYTLSYRSIYNNYLAIINKNKKSQQ